MSFYIHVQETPNPNAVKFISQYVVKEVGKSQYSSVDEADPQNPLAMILLELEGVQTVFFFDNYITVTKDPDYPWDDLVTTVIQVLQLQLPTHNPEYEDPDTGPKRQNVDDLSPPMQVISEILDRTVRPYLVSDGGDVTLISLEDHILTIKYEGACGTCPSSAHGTLMAIEGVLRDEYDPKLRVVDSGDGFAFFSGY